ncbi:hypothetical protein MRX96_000140 [Rhipicephalus microplus]
MNTTSARKNSRSSESGSNDEDASRKTHGEATERATATSLNTSSKDAVAYEDSVIHETDGTHEFQTIFFKSKKRRQRALTSLGTAVHTGPRPATAPTAMPAHVAPRAC